MLLCALVAAAVSAPDAAHAWVVNQTYLSARTAVGPVNAAPSNTDRRFTGVGFYCRERRPIFYIYGSGMPRTLSLAIELDGTRQPLRVQHDGDTHWATSVPPAWARQVARASRLRVSTDGGRNWNAIEMAGANAAIQRALGGCMQ